VSQQNDIEQIELSIEEAQKMVERASMARRLADNPDFKALVLEGYFEKEAARLANLISHPSLGENHKHVWNDMMGIGAFRRYLSTAIQMGDLAEREIEEARETLDEIRGEEAGVLE
jgi:hypothetical protein